MQNNNSNDPNGSVVDEAPSSLTDSFELASASKSEVQMSQTNIKSRLSFFLEICEFSNLHQVVCKCLFIFLLSLLTWTLV